MNIFDGKTKKHANAVFEGGGVKGIGMVGALSVAEKYYEWDYVAGTSAGAIVASLIAAGFTATEIRELIFNIDYTRFGDSDCLGGVPLLGPFLKLKFQLGINSGHYIEEWIREELKRKGVERFGDLTVPGHQRNSQWKYRLRVIASDISKGKMLILPQDIINYGIDPDYLEVAKAIRMSLSIPFFFKPVHLHYMTDDGRDMVSYIVDGGVLSNFPVWLFDNPGQFHGNPTFGFKLVGPKQGRPREITGPLSMFKALFGTMMDAHDNRFIEEKNFDRTVRIPTLGVGTTDFGISDEKKTQLFASGVEAAQKFFEGWDYQRYLVKHVVK